MVRYALAFRRAPAKAHSSGNLKPTTAQYWDINKAQSTNGVVEFPFLSTTTGSWVVYLLNNHNVDITGKTITATMNWTPPIPSATPPVTYVARSSGAYVRLEFQDVTTNPHSFNDYWWYSGSLDLNGVTSGGTLTAPLTDRANWTNLCGKAASDTTIFTGPDCLGGTYPAVSPYDGFTNAMKNVKEIGLGFGSATSYASGIAIENGTGPYTFQLTSFLVQ